jgi:U4/U6 small nuclear ribonucleoprotein PRP3
MDSSRKRPLNDGTVSPAKRPKAGGPDQERIQKMMAEARAKAAALAAKLGANKTATASPAPDGVPTPAQTAAERLAAMRSRVANAVSRSTAASVAPPARPAPHTPAPTFRRDEPEHDDGSKARGGLDVGLHPALLGDTADAGSSRRGKVAPKFATTMANRRSDGGRGGKPKKQLDLSAPSPDLVDPSKNPYYDPNIAAKSLQPRRIPKSLHFNEKGKYIEQANALRRQAALEEMKKRIALAARKAGIDEDMHADKAFAVSTPHFHISLYARMCYANMQPV